jgi:hypothetical protein
VKIAATNWQGCAIPELGRPPPACRDFWIVLRRIPYVPWRDFAKFSTAGKRRQFFHRTTTGIGPLVGWSCYLADNASAWRQDTIIG